MTKENYEQAKFYLSLINEQLKIKTHLGGEGGRDGIISDELGGEIGHLFPNMSMLNSAIYTAHCLINEFKKVHDHKMHDLEIKAHYWEKFGKDAHDREEKIRIEAIRARENKK